MRLNIVLALAKALLLFYGRSHHADRFFTNVFCQQGRFTDTRIALAKPERKQYNTQITAQAQELNLGGTYLPTTHKKVFVFSCWRPNVFTFDRSVPFTTAASSQQHSIDTNDTLSVYNRQSSTSYGWPKSKSSVFAAVDVFNFIQSYGWHAQKLMQCSKIWKLKLFISECTCTVRVRVLENKLSIILWLFCESVRSDYYVWMGFCSVMNECFFYVEFNFAMFYMFIKSKYYAANKKKY